MNPRHLSARGIACHNSIPTCEFQAPFFDLQLRMPGKLADFTDELPGLTQKIEGRIAFDLVLCYILKLADGLIYREEN